MEKPVGIQQGLFQDNLGLPFRFITNRTNLLTILDAGFIDTASRSWRYSPDSRELYDGLIPLVSGPFPKEFQPFYESNDPNFPVVLEFNEKLNEWFRNTTESGAPNKSSVLICDGLIPLAYLNLIVFRTSVELDDYVLRSTEEIPFAREFFATAGSDYLDWCEASPAPINLQINPPEKVGKRLGAAISILQFYEFSNNSVDVLLSLIESIASQTDATSQPIFRDNILHNGIEEKTKNSLASDEWLINTVFYYCINTSEPDTFTQDDLYEFIKSKSENLELSVREDINTWLSYISKIFDSEIDIPQLPDTGRIIKRAILLFALRPNIKRFEKLESSTLNPGTKVKLVAAYLLGALWGHQHIGPSFRKNASLYFDLIKSMLDRLMRNAQDPLFKTRVQESNDLETGYDLLFNGEIIKEWVSKPDPLLGQVFYQALGADYQLKYDHAHNFLWTELALPGGRKQKVYITRGRPNSRGDAILRFFSPCLDLKAKETKFLKRDRLLDLLKRNSDPGMYCRFAIDEKLHAVTVIVDQIHGTMDEQELIAHLEYVASTADAYEKETAGSDKY